MKSKSEGSRVSTIDRYEQCLNALWLAVMTYLRGTSTDLIRAVSFPEVLEDSTPLYAAIDAHFRDQEVIQQLRREKEEARADAEPFPSDSPLAARCKELQSFDRQVEAAAAICLAGSAWFPALASAYAFEKGGDGHGAARAIEEIYHLPPVVERRGAHPERRVEGLWELLESFLRNDEPYRGKSRAYLRGALKKESRRKLRDREIQDGDCLGLTPKLSSLEGKDAVAHRRGINRSATATDSFADNVPQDCQSALEVLIAAEDERERQEVIGTFRTGLPEELCVLLAAWDSGEPLSTARQRLGLRKSAENALRGRLARLKKKLDAA